jgi:phosphoglycolate phosphatase-like HAD superfamily hydrolase
MTPVRGVILDVDGTLVDSNDAHARAWVEALAERGIRADFGEIRRRIGMGGDKLLPAVTGIREDSPEGQALSKRRREIFKERYLPTLRAFPGSRELLQHMRDGGLKLAVARSARKDELTPLLRLCGAEDLVHAQTSSDDVEQSKPDPDVVGAALREIGMKPGEAVMLGDTPYDVEAARRAGVATVAVRSGGWDDAGLAGAVAIYDGPADLLAHYDSSPLARGL